MKFIPDSTSYAISSLQAGETGKSELHTDLELPSPVYIKQYNEGQYTHALAISPDGNKEHVKLLGSFRVCKPA